MALCLAFDVALTIMNAPVVGSPIMDELLWEGSERCFDRSAFLGYSSYYPDNDSDHFVKCKTGHLKLQVSVMLLHMVVIYDCNCMLA